MSGDNAFEDYLLARPKPTAADIEIVSRAWLSEQAAYVDGDDNGWATEAIIDVHNLGEELTWRLILSLARWSIQAT